jgi:hypothetical protein
MSIDKVKGEGIRANDFSGGIWNPERIPVF